MISNTQKALLEGGSNNSDKPYRAKDLARCSTIEARALIPFSRAESMGILPLSIMKEHGRDVLSCLSSDAENTELLAQVKFVAGIQSKLISAPKEVLDEAIYTAYQGDSNEIRKVIDRAIDSVKQERSSLSLVSDNTPKLLGDSAKLLQSLLEYAVARSASDLQISPGAETCNIKLRVDGEMYAYEGPKIPLTVHSQMLGRLKVISGLDTTIKFKPQDGAFSFKVGQRNFTARLSLVPSLYGETAAIRLFGKSTPPALHELGLHPKALEILQPIISSQNGMIILCGPTGSGKSTTLYSILSQMTNRNKNIITIEDPIEREITGAIQIPIDQTRGVDCENVLRSVLRQDPDILLIGEIRDKNSAILAMETALTGHLVMTTLHARSVFGIIPRLNSLGVSLENSLNAVKVVLYQRLLPKLCSFCKIADTLGAQQFKQVVFKAVGCPDCDYTGHNGRVLIAEVLNFDSNVRESLSLGQFEIEDLAANLSSKNFLSLTQSIEKVVKDGLVSWEQLFNHIDDL